MRKAFVALALASLLGPACERSSKLPEETLYPDGGLSWHGSGKERKASLDACLGSDEEPVPASGRVVFLFDVNATGRVESVQVDRNALHDPELESCLAAAVKTWSFDPPGESRTAMLAIDVVGEKRQTWAYHPEEGVLPPPHLAYARSRGMVSQAGGVMRPCADERIVDATYSFRLIVSSFGQVKRVLLNYQEGGSDTQRDCLTTRLKEVRFPPDHTVGDRSYGIAFAWMP